MDLKKMSFRQLARLYNALCSKLERTNSPDTRFALVKVEAETDRRIALVRL